MKGRMLLLGVSLLFTLVYIKGWAQEKYLPKENEELSGRWKDDTATDMQTVYDSVGFRTYYGTANDVLLNEATQEIENKWTDIEGNVWYKTRGVFVGESPYLGTKFQALYEVNKSKTMLTCWANTVNEYDSSNYPQEYAPKANFESHYHRAER
jgi:hypothetical protein